MNLRSFLLLALTVMAFSISSVQADHHAKKTEGAFRHVVLFKFKEGTAAEKITEIENAFRALPSKIDTIKDFEWGTSKTVEEPLAQGYTHCFLVTFADQAGLEVYIPHPDHLAFVDILKPHLEEVHVFDYTASK